jgi:hypothetical protein
VPYNDAGWAAYETERTAHYEIVNDKKRAELRAKSDPYWNKRREAAKQWLAKVDEVKVPELPEKASLPRSNTSTTSSRPPSRKVKSQTAHKGSVDYLQSRCSPFSKRSASNAIAARKPRAICNSTRSSRRHQRRRKRRRGHHPGKPDHSAILKRVVSDDEDEVMPPKGQTHRQSRGRSLLTTWIKEGACGPNPCRPPHAHAALTDDLTFLRRVTLDTVGVTPSLAEIDRFPKEPDRKALIDRLPQ